MTSRDEPPASESGICSALIMAGGRSERMRATSGQRHKALVAVRGVPLLERNLCSLLSAGFRDVVVALSALEGAVEDYLQQRGQPLAAALGASLRCYKERSPQGTIGAAGHIETQSADLLVVNVDNLTTLDLRALVRHHTHSQAAFTIACHEEPFQIPFGELSVGEGYVTRYEEKPVRKISISSGTYVLGPTAKSMVSGQNRIDVPQLVSRLLAAGQRVAAFTHQAAWIDVNDAAAVRHAERMVRDHFQAFEHWHRSPDYEIAQVSMTSPAGILIRRSKDCSPHSEAPWTLPGDVVSPHQTALEVAQKYCDLRGWPHPDLKFVVSFDELDMGTRQLIRHHVFSSRTGEWPCGQPRDWRWASLAEMTSLHPASSALMRSASYLGESI